MTKTGAKLGIMVAIAASVAATITSSSEVPDMHLKAAPFLLYASHPSMPIPPLHFSSEGGHSLKTMAATDSISNLSNIPTYLPLSPSSSSPIRQNKRPTQSPTLHSISTSFAANSSVSHMCSLFKNSSVSPSSPASKLTSFRYSFAASDQLPTPDLHYRKYTAERQSSDTENNGGDTEKIKSATTVVLLGWLGAQQKHLRRYAEWYTARGLNAVTFVIPMKDTISLDFGRKPEELIEHLAQHITNWLSEEAIDGKEKCLLFHTFSNTGWLAYGVLLEKLLKENSSLLTKIKGCVVDSAPVTEPDPQVWASGFSAALLKKRSIMRQKGGELEISKVMMQNVADDAVIQQPNTALTEVALKVVLERFFSLFLELPHVKQRLHEVVDVLCKQQPQCPQLYIYSSADTVIPSRLVESFVEEQKKAGHCVKACDFLWSPHVDHFRNFPEIYSYQLKMFLQECLPQ
ncbi:hypothetical protein O6H91_18G065900 [Diphasiastrum complanatum]|uniref:Uncharacterized protein n=4 Tax=Diphasiastrum complanatum TaxID=34168 RepID=A0ACC2B290_DIPCM|nr:hypothetical protein O6H91_18G065900 [Diphasiastrum complanatum]KAJ7523869.1 hypothetical protein O6H91_18G065900 [Diphasiastrum complanatum]KAJ7523870.1 hypothetical protein O6H91_18G065900 [Diphasiastrum complanatum]KAJ7523871.1 hypothetical protein O6H91_18G065900 [Diphasiastrum complanatum]